MDIVNFWKDQIAKWNADSKCGFCWSFGAPLTESAANLQKAVEGEACCVQSLLVRDKVIAFQTGTEYHPVTGLPIRITCTKTFQMLFLLPNDIGQNNYNEIPGHDVEQSKWATTLQKLEDCLACDANLDFCTILSRDVRVTMWSAKQEINLFDNNYSGYRLTISFQETK